MTARWAPLAAGSPIEHVLPHELFSVGPCVFTNDMLMQLVVAAVMVVTFVWVSRNYPLIPTGIRLFFETGLQVIREGIVRPALKEHTDRYVPFVWTLFFFILVNNLIGLVPLNQMFGLAAGRWHLFGSATSNLSVTASLAVLVFIVTHVSGMLEEVRRQIYQGRGRPGAVAVGVVLYWRHLVPHVPGVLGVVMFPALFILELMGSLIKPFALAMRLFANIMAGHILLAALLLLAPAIHGAVSSGLVVTVILGCTAVSCLELFVAFLQAYIFAFLSCLYIGMAVHPEH